MAAPALKCVLWLVVVIITHARGGLSQPMISIDLTIPVNPVRQGAVIGVHCNINGMGNDRRHVVRISRQLKGERIDLLTRGSLVTLDDDRMFIAVRQLRDGSTVYFLSISHASKTDQSTYFCTVMDRHRMEVIASDSAVVELEYVPSDNFPQCHSSGHVNYQFKDDTGFNLNCTSKSEKGYPAVSITWNRCHGNRTDSLRDHDVITEYTGVKDLVTSTLTTTPTIEDNGTIFVCSISSPTYRRVYTCYVGPLYIYRNPHRQINDITYNTSPNPMTNLSLTTNILGDKMHDNMEFYIWAIAISVAIFFIVFTLMIAIYVLLYSKRCQVVNNNAHQPRQRRNNARVEYHRRAEPNIYMTV